ncbi:hypothetical protein COSO111634_20850 [Corallococcus soli]
MVEAAPRRSTQGVGAAHRQGTPRAPVHERGAPRRAPAFGVGGAAAGAGTAGRRDALHGAARRVAGVVVALLTAGGAAGGLAHRGPRPGGAGGAGRLLREHAGAARARAPGGHVPDAAHPGPGLDALRVRAPGPAVREAGGGAPGGSRLEPQPPGAGRLRAPERPHRGAEGARAHAAPGAGGQRHGALRPGPLAARGAGRPPRRPRIQHRPLRALHGGAAAGTPAHVAGRGRRRPGRADGPPGVDHARRAPAGAHDVERHRRGLPARVEPRRVLRAAGRPASGGHRAGVRRRAPDVRPARCARECAGPPAALARRGPGCARGRVPGALRRAHRHAAGHPQGGGRLRPAGCRVSAAAAVPHAGGRPTPAARHHARPALLAVGVGGGAVRLRGGRIPGGSAHHRTGRGPLRAKPRLRGLHLREHRPSQGRRRGAPGRAAPAARRHLGPLHAGGGLPAPRAAVLRRVHAGDLGTAPVRRAARRLPAPAAHRPGAAGPGHPPSRRHVALPVRGPVRAGGGREAGGAARTATALRGRGCPVALAHASRAGDAGPTRGQWLRPHRGHRLHLLPAHGAARGRARGPAPHRSSRGEHAGVCGGRGAPARARGRARRAAHWR